MFTGKRVLITGGTGSLGKTMVARLLSGDAGLPAKIIVFSRDEAKQHAMRVAYEHRRAATDEVIYRNFERVLEFRIGDVRDAASVRAAASDADIIFNAAALKQVPTCEYFPFEAVLTNIGGAQNIVRAIVEGKLAVETVVGISTDKACKPVNVMGMTKAIQERVFTRANLACPDTRFINVRYGNVLASRGSVIPLFHDQIRNGGPVTITTVEMTRFLLSLQQAVDTVFAAVREAHPGELYVPRVRPARVVDIATALIGDRPLKTEVVGIRPGEKVHEILVSEMEGHHTITRGEYFVILPILPELRRPSEAAETLRKEYSSADQVLTLEDLGRLLAEHHLLVDDKPGEEEEVLA